MRARGVCVLTAIALLVCATSVVGAEHNCSRVLRGQDAYDGSRYQSRLARSAANHLTVLHCDRAVYTEARVNEHGSVERLASSSYVWQGLAAIADVHITHNPRMPWHLMVPCATNYYGAQRELDAVSPVPQAKTAAAVDGGDLLNHKSRLQSTLRELGIAAAMPPAWAKYDVPSAAAGDGRRFLLKSTRHRSEGLLLVDSVDEAVRQMSIESRRNYLAAQQVVEPPFANEHGHATSLRVYMLVVCQGGRLRAFAHDDMRIKYAPIPYSRTGGLRALATISTPETKRLYAERRFAVTLPELCKRTRRCIAAEVATLTRQLLGSVVGALAANCYLCRRHSEGMRYQVFGADLVMDADARRVWLLELNKGPDLAYAPNVTYASVKERVMHDVYCLLGVGCRRHHNQEHRFSELPTDTVQS